ncbi:MAG: DUF5652 family protein [Candidatus Paceibacterota bacterium]|nr:MAG: DUF5652 family protein [Candidatus Paceibacterota bacterium]
MADLLGPEFTSFVGNNSALFLLILVWSLLWKGIALWKAARLSHKRWFVIILIVNTLGILDIIYIFFVANRYKVETNETNN